jgi:hypothetical protein
MFCISIKKLALTKEWKKIHIPYLRGRYCHNDRTGKITFLKVRAGGTYIYHCTLKGKELLVYKTVESKSMNA